MLFLKEIRPYLPTLTMSFPLLNQTVASVQGWVGATGLGCLVECGKSFDGGWPYRRQMIRRFHPLEWSMPGIRFHV